jgi:hypothetical protein
MMGDQKQWFKVWTTILLDPDFQMLTMEDRGRWVTLGALAAQHGESGVLSCPCGYLEKILQISDIFSLSLPNIKLKNSHDRVTVTFINWYKYQTDSTYLDRKRKQRSLQNVTKQPSYPQDVTAQEENRREENRKESAIEPVDNSQTGPSEEQKKRLSELCSNIQKKYSRDRFNPFQWMQKNITANPEALIHVLSSLESKGDIIHPWAYCQKILSIENGNHNEADFQAGIKNKGNVFADLVTDLKKLHLKEE